MSKTCQKQPKNHPTSPKNTLNHLYIYLYFYGLALASSMHLRIVHPQVPQAERCAWRRPNYAEGLGVLDQLDHLGLGLPVG